RLRVDEERDLLVRALEVEHESIAVHGERARSVDELVSPFRPADRSILPRFEHADATSQLPLRQLHQGVESPGELVHTNAAHELYELHLGHVAAGHETAEVHLDETGEADVDTEEVPHVRDLVATLHEAHGRNPERLLEAVGGVRGP